MPALYSSLKLAPHILGTELDIKHGSVDMGVAHEAHESRKRDACPNHIGAKGVTEAMRICLGNSGQTAVMAKYRAKTCRCEGVSPVWAFEDYEKVCRARLRPLRAKVAIDQLDSLWVKGEQSFAVSFSVNENFALCQMKVFEF